MAGLDENELSSGEEEELLEWYPFTDRQRKKIIRGTHRVRPVGGEFELVKRLPTRIQASAMDAALAIVREFETCPDDGYTVTGWLNRVDDCVDWLKREVALDSVILWCEGEPTHHFCEHFWCYEIGGNSEVPAADLLNDVGRVLGLADFAGATLHEVLRTCAFNKTERCRFVECSPEYWTRSYKRIPSRICELRIRLLSALVCPYDLRVSDFPSRSQNVTSLGAVLHLERLLLKENDVWTN